MKRARTLVVILCAPFAFSQGKSRQLAELLSSDGIPGQRLGIFVSVNGNVVAVNSVLSGVYLYSVSSKGTVTQIAKLTASDGTLLYGGVAIGDGGRVVVAGAPEQDNSDGAAYVFVRPSSGWVDATETAILTASDRGQTDHDSFGGSVAIDKNVIVVGESQYDGVDDGTGKAYIYVEPKGGWTTGTETAKLTASNGRPSDAFGVSVAQFGPRIIVGAPGVNTFAGAVYVFQEPVGGWHSMTETAILTQPSSTQFLFGAEVAVYKTTVVAGAEGRYCDGACDPGAAYIYEQPPNGWRSTSTPNATLTANYTGDPLFGDSLAIDAQMIVVGDPFNRWGYHYQERGIAFAFLKPAGGWTNSDSGIPIKNINAGELGTVAVMKNKVYVGANQTNVGQNQEQGSAYIFAVIP
jgi:FG-GAP repeat